MVILLHAENLWHIKKKPDFRIPDIFLALSLNIERDSRVKLHVSWLNLAVFHDIR